MQKLIDIFSMGGPVMIPLAGLGFVGAIIFLERLLYLHKGQIRAVEFVSGIKTALKTGGFSKQSQFATKASARFRES